MVGGIKTEAGINREIPLHNRIIPIIRDLMATGKTYLCQMNEDNWYRQCWEMVHHTGIRELPPQTCRHYYFSTLTANDVSGGVIAETGGHASYLTTMKNYVRLSIADKLAAIDTMK